MNQNNALRQGKSQLREQWKKKLAEIGDPPKSVMRESLPCSDSAIPSILNPVSAIPSILNPVSAIPSILNHPKRWDSRTRGKLESEEPVCWVDEAATISEEAWAMLARKSPNV